jgi:hypothetical protein
MSLLNEGADIDAGIAARIKNDIIEPANRKKAQKFAENAYKPLAQAIYDFVMEIGITLTPRGTLLAPQAPSGTLPVTGAASTTTKDFTIT